MPAEEDPGDHLSAPHVQLLVPPSEQHMVFRARSKSPPHSRVALKKTTGKSTSARIKARISTPAPPTKGEGRKRVINSPTPEDKQIRKKIDFGDTDEECEDELAENSNSGQDLAGENGNKPAENPLPPNECRDLMVISAEKEAPTAMGENGSRVEMIPAPERNILAADVLHLPETATSCVRIEAHVAKNAFAAAIVNLPETAKETKGGGESDLDSTKLGSSRDGDDCMVLDQPKKDSLLQVVSLNSAESFDCLTAQPLLRRDQPEKLQSKFSNAEGNIGAEVIHQSTEVHYVAPLDQFPPLERGRTRKIREAYEKGTLVATAAPAWQDRQRRGTGEVEQSTNRGGQAGAVIPPADGLSIEAPPATSRAEAPEVIRTRTMADLVREKTEADGPQAFEPEKLRNIGSVSFNNGIPAIYFSGEETKKLADNMGFAIVGKFSHSIPSPQQIQKALNNIKFGRRYTWKFINAKHILVQFDDLNDYARLLSGPKGTPVWYVDRHPMRVFKWSPEFDVYCESPIAAIWCNLINLPIHLFDTEALFAIGKLLGNPIQVDRATANKSRLSFARICVEIDITKPPTEEIILDFCGKEIGQQVRWDKIPDYCLDCKHVGHNERLLCQWEAGTTSKEKLQPTNTCY